MYQIEVINAQGGVIAASQGAQDARLVHKSVYQPGDSIRFTAAQAHAGVLVDQAVIPASVYLPHRSFTYRIPFGDAKNGYAPQAFSGDLHTLWIGPSESGPETVRRNLAGNPADQRGDSSCYPHAEANVETRGEAQFWARNVIDGHRFNDGHGAWPHHSWGIGERRDAWLRIDFGRPVRIDEVCLTLRADFPHDAWWERATLDCSDGFSTVLPLLRTAEPQRFPLGRHTVTWVRLRDLVKAEDPSPFPALTQIEVYGTDAQG